MPIDNLYRKHPHPVDRFAFDERVASVFDDMIGRSVPGYFDVVELTCSLVKELHPRDGAIYDLGCSTGTVLIALARTLEDRSVRLIGIDNAPPMLDACRERLSRYVFGDRIELRLGSLEEVSLDEPGGVILNYTLQFTPPESRLETLRRICEALPENGFLILSEKIRFSTPLLHRAIESLHVAFKKRNHYTDLEIARKREALDGVLVPLTSEENLDHLSRAGFSYAACIAQHLNFATFAALKGEPSGRR
jgi:tRNA (cmo5U34)-methyltransferase